ncbi:polycomb group RING finger protein 1 isoform X1 [Strix uralensis]|uniref:polycomb group RING finger protein 1 isoform X1 n=1 Tax=Strix uralensis TaxID=36305 RepID=UPI003DA7487D
MASPPQGGPMAIAMRLRNQLQAVYKMDPLRNEEEVKVKMKELNEHIVCCLCAGYFIDATTITECLHTFCKSCIVKYLQTSKYCPMCNTKIHETQPLLNLKLDRVMQDIVYKLVPGLQESEEKRIREFYQSRGLDRVTQPSSEAPSITPAPTISATTSTSRSVWRSRGGCCRRAGEKGGARGCHWALAAPALCPVPPNSVNRCRGGSRCCGSAASASSVPGVRRGGTAGGPPAPELSGCPFSSLRSSSKDKGKAVLQQKYVRCSVRAQIRHLRRVLCHRLGLPLQHVQILFNNEALPDHMTMKQLWLSRWFGKPAPLLLHYSIKDKRR